MLANDYQRQLRERIRAATCQIAIPRSMQSRFLQRGPIEPIYDDRRRFVRFQSPTKILIEIQTTIKAIIRDRHFYCGLLSDVSREGLGFLHVQQLYPGESPILWLPKEKLPCQVVRCREFNNRCFEIGVTFDQGPKPASWLREISGVLAFQRGLSE